MVVGVNMIQERFIRDGLPVRLGGLAANLARIKSFSNHPDHQEVVASMLNESKFFIEWAAPDAELDTQAILVELQLQIAQWQCRWADPARRKAMAEQAGEWSKRVLEMSGLLR